MNHQSYSPVVKHFAWLWWSPTASEALSYRLNLYRSMPPDLPRTLCIIRSKIKFGALRAPHGRTNPTLYLCPGTPLLQPLGPPLCMTGGFSASIADCIWLVMHLVRLYVCMHVVENERVHLAKQVYGGHGELHSKRYFT